MKSVVWAGLVSLGVHGALGWAVMRAPAGWLGAARPTEPLRFEVIDPEPMPPREERHVPPAPPEPEPEAPRPPEPGAVDRRPRVGLPSPLEPGEVAEPDQGATADAVPSDIETPDVTLDEPPNPDRRRDPRSMSVLLDPSNVARDFYVPEGAPSQRGAPASRAAGGTERPSEADLERQHREHLRGRAMARPWLARTEPELRRQPDGSLRYDGHRFRATIRPDGSVIFDENGAAGIDGMNPFRGNFDLSDAIMGNAQANAAEREWFMRRTRELRHRLEARARAAENERGLRLLRGRLRRVWATEGRSPAARRRRIFDIWDDMSEDDNGRAARRVVIAFIRQTLPEGSEHAYTDEELRALNARRQSEARFEPY